MSIHTFRHTVTVAGREYTKSLSATIATALPLDEAGLTGVDHAYSTRLLLAAFTDPIIRVRRSSDNAETDVYPDSSTRRVVSGTSVVAAGGDLATWMGASDLFVVTWYDQVGSADLSQATGGNQPVLANAGTLVTDALGRVQVHFNAKQMDSGDGALAGSTDDLVIIMQATNRNLTNKTRLLWIDDDANEVSVGLTVDGGNEFEVNINSNEQKTGPDCFFVEEPCILAARINGSNIYQYHHLELLATTALTGTISDTDNLKIGSTADLGDFYVGDIIVGDLTMDYAAQMSALDTLSGIYSAAAVPDQLVRQVFTYETVLYSVLERITTSEVAFTAGQSLSYSTGASVDELWPVVVGLRDTKPRPRLAQVPASSFVLDDGAGGGYIGSGTLQMTEFTSKDEAAESDTVWFHDLTFTGLTNPFYQASGITYRLLSQGLIHLLELQRTIRSTSIQYRDHWGQRLNQCLTALYSSRSLLSTAEKTQLYNCILAALEGYAAQGYARDATTNIDTKTMPALAIAWKMMDADGFATEAAEVLDHFKVLTIGNTTDGPDDADGITDGVIFHSMGYFGEEGWYDAGYGGISLFYALKAAGIVYGEADWADLWDSDGIIDRCLRFKALQIFPDPDGQVNSPGGWNKRTTDGAALDQSSSEGKAYLASYMSSWGKNILGRRYSGGFTPATEAVGALETELGTQLSSLVTTSLSASMKTLNTSSDYWSDRIGCLLSQYIPAGYHTTLGALISGSDPSLDLPYEKAATLSLLLGRDADFATYPPEAWFHKDTDGSQMFAAVIETVSDKGTGYNGIGQGGSLLGGSIQAWWLELAGLLVKTVHAKYDGAKSDLRTYADIIPMMHVWGVKNGAVFTSSKQQTYTVVYDDTGTPTTVTVNNEPRILHATEAWSGVNDVANTITPLADGYRIQAAWDSDQVDTDITQTKFTIPVYRHANRASNPVTSIEYWNGSGWSTLTQTPVSTDAIRLGRNYGAGAQYGYIKFGVSESVYIAQDDSDTSGESPAGDYSTGYQTEDRFRNVHVDIHASPGTPQAVADKTVQADLVTTDPHP